MRIRRNEALEYAYQERKWRINERVKREYTSIYIYPYTWWEDENYRQFGEDWQKCKEFYSKDGYVVEWRGIIDE